MAPLRAFRCLLLPRHAQLREEVGSRRRLLREGVVAAVPVDADGRRADERGRGLSRFADEPAERTGGEETAPDERYLPRGRPAGTADVLAGEVDDDVRPGTGRGPGADAAVAAPGDVLDRDFLGQSG